MAGDRGPVAGREVGRGPADARSGQAWDHEAGTRAGVSAGSPRVIVYTCVTGGYDELLPPAHVDDGVEYLCFTDAGPVDAPPWKAVPVGLPHLSARDASRYVKMHPHRVLPPHELSVYFDGNVQVVGSLRDLIARARASDAAVFLYDHHSRRCAYDEAAACVRYPKAWVWAVARTMRRYGAEGFPAGAGLYEANVIVRKSRADAARLMETWWAEYARGARRDQLSLPYASWRTGVAIGSLGRSDPRHEQRTFRLLLHRGELSPRPRLQRVVNRTVASLVGYRRLFGVAADPGLA